MATYPVKVFFLDDNGDRAAALVPTPVVTIINYTSGVEEITDAATVNKGKGWYGYDFATYDPSMEYMCDAFESSLTGSNRYYHIGFGGESGQTAQVEATTIPTAISSLTDKLNWLFSYFRNEKVVTDILETLKKEDGTALGTATLAKTGTSYTKGEMS